MLFLTMLIQIVLLLAFTWAALVTLWGLFSKTPPKKNTVNEETFAVIICAHNEETVIAKLLASLEQQNYPHQLYQVFLLADHCTDGTIAKASAFPHTLIYAREDGPRTGKGEVLRWGLNKIKEKYGDSFKQVVVFDADNIAAPNFLARMNDGFSRGAKLLMGNRQALNPYVSTISGWYTLYWQTVDALYCKPRSNLGMSAILSGTGFAFAWELIQKNGWQTTTITEDIEFSMQQNLKGIFAVYLEEALFYDEQPSDFKTLLSQLRRWCTGNYQVFTRYKKDWWQVFRKNPTMKLLDNVIPIGLCCGFGWYLIFSFFWLLYNAFHHFNPFGLVDICWWGGLYFLSVSVGFIAARAGNFQLRKMYLSILTSGIYCIIFSLVAVFSLFVPVKGWKPIVHLGKK